MQLAKYVKFREEQFGGVLFETQSEKVFTLNAAAVAVVRELPAGGDAGAIAARLKQRYRDPAGAIERDVAALIDELRAKGLIVEATA
ncbi:MAG: PqqD family protein [Acidiphilium sp.]|nr:PqqD family protein [Acidiphilium sp.]MDD4935107.1 PqqD family protein [Acidiphilium sp.]